LSEKVKETVATIRAYAPLTANFARRELKSRFRGSVLGWLWSLLNPLSTVLVYALVFGVILKIVPPLAGSGELNFSMYLFSGLVVWLLFSAMFTGVSGWLASIGDLRRKIFFPPETAVFGSAAAAGVQSAIEAAVLVAFMVAFGNVGITFIALPAVMLLTAGFGLGLGFLVAVANVRYRDVEYLIGIALNVVFFLVPIVYTEDLVPDRAYGLPVGRIISLNPVAQFVGAGRDAVYFLQWPSVGRWVSMICWSVGALSIGWRYFSRRSMDLSEEL
jgi:ABC-type polysaccharide/polyol phosphate export permease